jgi:signal transduction histidine kinase
VGQGEGRQAAGEDPVPADPVHLPARLHHHPRACRHTDRAVIPLTESRDRLIAFRPAILAIRWGTTGVGVVLAALSFQSGEGWTIAFCGLITAYTIFRTITPLQYVEDRKSLLAMIAEVLLPVTAVVLTGFWDSPFVFSLITSVIIAGFAKGFGFALRFAAASSIIVGASSLLNHHHNYRVAAQWTIELVLVALVAGYARRISGEADRQHTLALDRLGRLTDANTLLFALHKVAQTLPASLDLDEVLDQTMSRLHDLFDFESAAILLLDETEGAWLVARREGTRLPAKLVAADLPRPLRSTLTLRTCVEETNLLIQGGPGLAPSMYSGIYTVLPARGATIGLVSLEHTEPGHFSARDVDLLNGFAEPAALAIDNARWFARLRTVGADEERTRIARDLHDRIGQSLAYLAFELDRIVKNDGKGDDVGGALDQLRSDVRGVIREVRDTLYDLRTDVTDSIDMLTVVDMFLQRVRDRSGLEITLRSDSSGRLPILQEREMFRIVQEAVVNVERHARASHITVTWQCDGNRAYLEVSDDGTGFPVGRAGRLDSYGILGMRERASSIGALLDVSSAVGSGTRVRVSLTPAGGEERRRRPARAPLEMGRTA